MWAQDGHRELHRPFHMNANARFPGQTWAMPPLLELNETLLKAPTARVPWGLRHPPGIIMAMELARQREGRRRRILAQQITTKTEQN